MDSLDQLTHREIILNTILLKQGNKNFYVKDLEKGLIRYSGKYLKSEIKQESVETTFFFFHPHLCGELNLPQYRLGEEGRKIINKEFNKYPFKLQQELRKFAKKVWNES